MRRTTNAVAAIAAAVVAAGVLGSVATVDAAPLPPRTGATTSVIELGRRLFFDPAVSVSGETSCASCHRPDHGFSSAEPLDDDDFTTTRRHSQTLVDVGASRSFHWDGEFPSIEALVESRLVGTGPVYYGVPTTPITPPPEVLVRRDDGAATPLDPSVRFVPVEQRLTEDARYAEAFLAAYDSRRATNARIAQSIAAYVRTLTSTDAPFDRWRRKADEPAMPEAAKRGFELFRGRAACSQCHSTSGFRSRFTDDAFHVTGVTSRSILRRTVGLAPGAGTDVGPDLGRQVRTSNVRDEAAFKTPTLRDVATRPPYMHDGSFETLDEVVRYYVKGGTPHRNLDARIKPFAATDDDVADLVAFLRSLTGDRRPGFAAPFTARARETRLRIVDAGGAPMAGLRVTLLPDGDAMPGGEPADATTVDTDAEGHVVFSPGSRTHTRVVLPDGLRATSAWVPDSCKRLELKVAVVGRAHVEVAVPVGVTLPVELRGSTGGELGTLRVSLPPSLLAGQGGEALRGALARSSGGMVAVLVVPERRIVTFRRVDDSVVDGVRVVHYAAWIGSGASEAVDLEVPLGDARVARSVAFRPAAVTRLDLR